MTNHLTNLVNKINMDATKMNELLKGFALTEEIKNLAKTHMSDWNSFGKMNSSVYRDILSKLMKESALSPEEMSMVYFFTSLIKNRHRILSGMDTILIAEEKKKYSRVRVFFETKTVQYTADAANAKKIAVVHIPHTNPGLDIYFWALTTSDIDRTIENMMERTTMVQIKLDPKMQEMAKNGYKKFWLETVTGTKKAGSSNEEAKRESAENWERYYETQAGDPRIRCRSANLAMRRQNGRRRSPRRPGLPRG